MIEIGGKDKGDKMKMSSGFMYRSSFAARVMVSESVRMYMTGNQWLIIGTSAVYQILGLTAQMVHDSWLIT